MAEMEKFSRTNLTKSKDPKQEKENYIYKMYHCETTKN